MLFGRQKAHKRAKFCSCFFSSNRAWSHVTCGLLRMRLTLPVSLARHYIETVALFAEPHGRRDLFSILRNVPAKYIFVRESSQECAQPCCHCSDGA